MADAFLVAVAAVSAADHERISKFWADKSWGLRSRSRNTDRDPLATSPAGLDSSQSLGEIHKLCYMMGVIRPIEIYRYFCRPISKFY